jgi:hypothetical protein
MPKMASVTAEAADIRRFAGWCLVAGLTLAAVAAIVALAIGDFGETDVRVIFTSLGFALFSATGSAGARAEADSPGALRRLGAATVLCSVVAFGLFAGAIWTFELYGPDPGLWRWFGCIAIAAIAGAHACVMLVARQSTDSELVRLLTTAAVGLGAFDALGVILPVSSLADDVGETWARVFGAALVLLVMASLVAPLLRRLQAARSPENRAEYVFEGT